MEIPLINSLGEDRNPLLEKSRVFAIKFKSIILRSLFEPDAEGDPWGPLILPLFSQNLKFELKINFAKIVEFLIVGGLG